MGYGGMWLVLDEAHITNIAVHPLARRKGIGEALLRVLMAEANRLGIQKITLEVRDSNTAAGICTKNWALSAWEGVKGTTAIIARMLLLCGI